MTAIPINILGPSKASGSVFPKAGNDPEIVRKNAASLSRALFEAFYFEGMPVPEYQDPKTYWDKLVAHLDGIANGTIKLPPVKCPHCQQEMPAVTG